MSWSHHVSAAMAVSLLLASTTEARAQIDYRNLDAGRPLETEDAYPVERYAFELVIGYEFLSEVGTGRTHVLTPELAYGATANGMVGVSLPVAAHVEADADYGLAGVGAFAFYNVNTESVRLPALALRMDLALPIGGLAPDDVMLALTGIATRSWGRTRAHVNVGALLTGGTTAPFHGPARWKLSGAVDRTVLRRSLLIGTEVTLQGSVDNAPTEVSAALGARMQLTPTFVLDAGIERRLRTNVGPDVALTFGLSHAFAIAALMPAQAR